MDGDGLRQTLEEWMAAWNERDIDRVAGLQGSFVCIEPRHGGPATVVASSIGPCPDRAARGDEACNACRTASGGDGLAR